jgi:glycosyltransferase involved in cell wall biosynthesis
MANRLPRVLLIGPLPPPIGGTRVSFRHLVEFLSEQPELTISVVELRPVRRNPMRSFSSAIALIVGLIFRIPRADVVSLHCNPSALSVLGLIVVLLAKVTRKPLMVRTFGGLPFLREYRGIRRALTRWVLAQADLYLAQTNAQLVMAREHGIKPVRWFPTSRPTLPPPSAPPSRGTCKRFVFCSHIKPSKGVHELIEAAERLGSDVVVDVYGPFRDGMTEAAFHGCSVVKYCGSLFPEQVVPTLKKYDVLLLPTFFEGEGHPGIIIEAYLAGIPVIATHWQAIPEIVNESTGLIVEPRSAAALQAAMRRLMDNPTLFHTLRAGVAKIAEHYSLDFWGFRFIELCRALSGRGALPADPDFAKGRHDPLSKRDVRGSAPSRSEARPES